MRSFQTLFATFYSYKGGVGRTSALVNSALIRAFHGDRVVVIDFDLEAPGVWSYVQELTKGSKGSAKNLKLDQRPGILEYLHDAINTSAVPKLAPRALTGEELGLKIPGKIWFVGPGDISRPDYSKKLGSLNWAAIFRENQGALLLENLRRQVISEFNGPDYVFIDSRTGITETGGVCTKYLADLVVTLTSLNDQNIRGSSKVANSFKKANIETILVASNVPVGLPWGKDQLFRKRIENFKKYFEKEPDLLIYHYPSLSLLENLPACFETKSENPVLRDDPLLKSYQILAKNIEDRNPNSFKKFIEECAGYFIRYSQDKEEQVLHAINFSEKYYGHRKDVFELLNIAYKIQKNIHPNTANAAKSFKSLLSIKMLRQLRDFKSIPEIPRLSMIRDIVWDEVSYEVVQNFENSNKINELKKWVNVLNRNGYVRAFELLLERKEYDFVFNNLKDEHFVYFCFARGFAARKLSKNKVAQKLFVEFVNNTVNIEPKASSASMAFIASYALFQIGEIEKAISYIKEARDLFKLNKNSRGFIPVLFRESKDRQEFLKELKIFEAELLAIEKSNKKRNEGKPENHKQLAL